MVSLVTVSGVEKHAASCQIHLVINKLATDIGLNLCLDLLLQNILENDSVCSKLRDTLTELLYRHLLLVEVEAECWLVVEVRLLLNVQRYSV